MISVIEFGFNVIECRRCRSENSTVTSAIVWFRLQIVLTKDILSEHFHVELLILLKNGKYFKLPPKCENFNENSAIKKSRINKEKKSVFPFLKKKHSLKF